MESGIDVSFSDLLDKMAYYLMAYYWMAYCCMAYYCMAYYEAGRKRTGHFIDLMYADLGPDVPGKASFEQIMLEAGGIYRRGTPEEAVDLLYGARYTDLSADLQITGQPRVKGSRDWLERFVGGRQSTQLSDRWLLSLRGDGGGFGAGSDLTWGLRGEFFYGLGPKNSLAVGWRYMDIDYDRSDFLFDVELNGPILASVWGL